MPDPAAAAAPAPGGGGPGGGGGRGGGRGGGGQAFCGQECTITQDATTLTVTRTTPGGEQKAVYKLDGSESKNTLNFNGTAIDQLSKTKVEDGKLTISTTMNFDGNAVQMSTVMSLDPAGNLIIETTRPDFQGGGAPITTKATYKKN